MVNPGWTANHLGSEPLSFFEIQTQTGWGQTLQGFADWCHPQPGWVTLDIGCGPGLLPAIFFRAGCTAYGLDLDAEMLSCERLHPDLIQGAANHLPFLSNTFNLVTASNLLFLLDLPARALNEFRRVIRPDGQVALLNPSEKMSVEAATALANKRGLQGLAYRSLINWAHQAETHQRWNKAELEEMLAAAKLRIEDTKLIVGEGLARLVKAIPV